MEEVKLVRQMKGKKHTITDESCGTNLIMEKMETCVWLYCSVLHARTDRCDFVNKADECCTPATPTSRW